MARQDNILIRSKGTVCGSIKPLATATAYSTTGVYAYDINTSKTTGMNTPAATPRSVNCTMARTLHTLLRG